MTTTRLWSSRRCRTTNQSSSPLGRSLLVAALTLALCGGADSASAEPACDWERIEPIPKRRAEVTSLRLRRPYLALSLGAGTLYGLQACGRTVGVVFLGEGEAGIASPGPQRTPQMHNRSPDLPGTALVDAVVLIGADGAVDDLIAQAGGLQDGPVPPSVWALVQARSNGFLTQNTDGWQPPGEVLAAPSPGLGGLLVELRTVSVRSANVDRSLEVLSPWFSYVWAPSGPLGDVREPGLWMRRPTGSTRSLLYGGFPSEDAVDSQATPFALEPLRAAWDLTSASLSIGISGPIGPDRQLETLQGRAELDLVASEHATAHIALSLDAGVRRVYGDPWVPWVVQGVSLVTGTNEVTPLPFLRTGDRLFATLPDAPAPGTAVRLVIRWTGDVLEPRGRTAISVLGSEAWYPRTPGVDRHRLTMMVAVPPFWEVVATGHRIGVEEQGRVKTVTSRTRVPVRAGALVIADVRTEVLKPAAQGLPLVRVHRGAEQPVPNARIAGELNSYLLTLLDLLGPFPYSELEIVERGLGTVGFQDLPGVIALRGFDSPPNQVATTRVSTDTLLGAVVRQWLETDRGPESYHDRWLVEGLVTWARCATLEQADLGARCHGELAGWRRSWIDLMTGPGLGDGSVARDLLAGAIWLDSTSGSGVANRAWRGPLILHALRLLVGDEVVHGTLRDLAQADTDISLASFLTAVQGLAQRDLRSYVYGWVLNTPSLPTARLRYQLTEADGSWTLSGLGHIDSGRRTEPPLPLPTPILLSFRVGEETVVHRLLLSEREASLKIEGLPAKPRDIRLDPGKTFPGRVDVERMD